VTSRPWQAWPWKCCFAAAPATCQHREQNSNQGLGREIRRDSWGSGKTSLAVLLAAATAHDVRWLLTRGQPRSI
jgi:hypothetical protein